MNYRTYSLVLAYARLGALSLLLTIATVGLSCSSASAALSVEEYGKNILNRRMAILTDSSLSVPERRAAIRELLRSSFDVRRMALFALGGAAATASPQEVAAYLKSFEDLTIENYVSMVEGYGGQTARITGSKERAPGDYLIFAEFSDSSASGGRKLSLVMFRVLANGEKFSVVDANVEGAWFGLAQRDSVQGFLATKGASISKLIEHINRLADQAPKVN